ncbi:MAG: metal ABC transporter permease [Planctomycetaceae bacterium]|nr:metal ABC transporter permease [Planctomycetaceae bacterium]
MHELHNIFFQPEYVFLRQAFFVSALASLSFGVIGTFVVARRIGYLAGAISHCAFGGIGIGIFLQQAVAAGMAAFAPLLDPIAVAVVFSIASALLIGVIQTRAKEREDSIIGAIWAIGMAVGVLFLDATPGYHSISSYLFGDILLISTNGARLVGLLGIVVLVTVIVYFKRLEAVCFDEEYMRLRGLNTHFYLQLLLVLVAMTVVLMIQLVGIILVIALLTLPAATAARISVRLFPMVCWATVLCFLFSWCGLFLSVRLNIAAGPTIILVAGAGYITALIGQTIIRKNNR